MYFSSCSSLCATWQLPILVSDGFSSFQFDLKGAENPFNNNNNKKRRKKSIVIPSFWKDRCLEKRIASGSINSSQTATDKTLVFLLRSDCDFSDTSILELYGGVRWNWLTFHHRALLIMARDSGDGGCLCVNILLNVVRGRQTGGQGHRWCLLHCEISVNACGQWYAWKLVCVYLPSHYLNGLMSWNNTPSFQTSLCWWEVWTRLLLCVCVCVYKRPGW